MAKLFENSGDPDQMQHSAASDRVCTVCQLPFYGSPDYSGLTLRMLGNFASFFIVCGFFYIFFFQLT